MANKLESKQKARVNKKMGNSNQNGKSKGKKAASNSVQKAQATSVTNNKPVNNVFWQTLRTRFLSTLIFVPLLIALIYFIGFEFTIIVVGIILTTEILRLMRNLKSKQRCVALFYLGFLYYVLFLFFIISTTQQGGYKILTFFILIACCDIGAYLFGSLCKGPKLCTAISPTKTFAGSLAGIIFPIVVYYLLLGYFTILPLIQLTFMQVLIVCVLAEVGDLLESALKRYFNIKDFANILPGHGGLLDRFDSSTLAIIYFYYFI